MEVHRWGGELRRFLRKNGRAETPEAKLRRLGRTFAESEADPLTTWHTLVDRAINRLMYKTTIFAKGAFLKKEMEQKQANSFFLL
ncbi:hypothetical protein [Rossellomorea aquimaris]|uniref:hypothetical protein n=1 Tax=Rossellomorea aquimaris TaxID=189382 RepID=UPI0007D04A38|nr:hypothetical protein [Rossellomorea aquimaris]